MGTATGFKPFCYCSSKPAKYPRISAVDLIETVQREGVFTYHHISPLPRRIPADSPWPKVIHFSYYYQQAASCRSSIFRGMVSLLKESCFFKNLFLALFVKTSESSALLNNYLPANSLGICDVMSTFQLFLIFITKERTNLAAPTRTHIRSNKVRLLRKDRTKRRNLKMEILPPLFLFFIRFRDIFYSKVPVSDMPDTTNK